MKERQAFPWFFSSFQIHSASISHDLYNSLLKKQVFNHSSTCPWSTVGMRHFAIVWWRCETLQSRNETKRKDAVSCRAVVPRPGAAGLLWPLTSLWSLKLPFWTSDIRSAALNLTSTVLKYFGLMTMSVDETMTAMSKATAHASLFLEIWLT